MKVIVKDRELIAQIRYENGNPVGYCDALSLLQALGVPTVVGNDGRLSVALRRFAEAMKLPHQYTSHDHTFWIASTPLPPLPVEPVGADRAPWHPVTAPICGGPGDRRAGLLERILQQFKVAVNPRYAIRDTSGDGLQDTFCNIYVWDVTRALGCEIPYWVVGDGIPSEPGKGREQDANAVIRWLRSRGPDYSWRPVKADKVMERANAGFPVLAAWHNPGGIGHVAMVRPGDADPARGFPIAQAGMTNADDIYLVDGFGRAAGAVEYFTHD